MLQSSKTKSVVCLVQFALSLSVALVVLLATLTFTPVSSGRSASSMSCCNGMAGHCESGMMSQKAPPPEPMCGLDADSAIHKITVVAEPSNSSSNEAPTASFTAPCGTECCSQVWAGYKRPNRDLNYLIQRRTIQQNHLEPLRRHPSSPDLFTSTSFNKSVPRGPPSLV